MSDVGDLIDVSRPLDPRRLPQWPGTPTLELERWLDMESGDPATDTRVSMSLHAGTHLDAPAHRIPGGRSIDDVDLGHLNGPCLVVDVTGYGQITAPVLEESGVPDDCERLLLKTDNSTRSSASFDPDFVAVTPGAAAWLTDRPLRLLGIDYLSVEAPEGDGRVHERLLRADVILLEGLDLADVDEGAYRMLCLPLRFVGTEAAPARACLSPMGPGEADTPE